MKNSKCLLLIAFLIISFSLFAQPEQNSTVSIIFKNGTWLPKNFTVITYVPGEPGNATNGYWLVPGFKKIVNYKVGTKIYVANKSQVNVVMSGKRIDKDIPLLIVKELDNNRVVYLK